MISAADTWPGALAQPSRLVGRALRGRIEDWITEAITQVSKALGASGDAFGVSQGWGSA